MAIDNAATGIVVAQGNRIWNLESNLVPQNWSIEKQDSLLYFGVSAQRECFVHDDTSYAIALVVGALT